MGLIDRVKNICITPKTEWDVIAGETTSAQALVTGYVLPLAAIAAVAGFIGGSIVGHSMGFLGSWRTPIGLGIGIAIFQLVMAVVLVFLVGFIIDALAPTFGAQKNFQQALKVAVYSYTPAWVAGILMILPLLGILVFLAALYGIYLMYLGLPRVMKNPDDKSAGYTAVVVVAAIVLGFIVSAISGVIMGLGGGMMGAASSMRATPPPAARVDPNSPMGKLDDFAKKMEDAGKKMEAAQKSGDPNKQMEAAMGALGAAVSGGSRAEPLQLDQLKPFVPDTFAGLPRTGSKSERAGPAGFLVATVEGTYGDGSGKQARLEVVDTGGMSGIMGLASWAGVQGEREDDNRIERTVKQGNRMVHEEVSKRGGGNKYSLVLADRFVVTASGTVDISQLKSSVGSLDLGKLESMK